LVENRDRHQKDFAYRGRLVYSLQTERDFKEYRGVLTISRSEGQYKSMVNLWKPRTRDGATLQVSLNAYREMSLANLMGMEVD
jgi:hypothetical protein